MNKMRIFVFLCTWIFYTPVVYQSISNEIFNGVLIEVYKSKNVIRNFSELVKNPNFPQNPDHLETSLFLDATSNTSKNYALRVRGWFLPAVTGSYGFFSSCDRSCQFYLSSDHNPENKVLIFENAKSLNQTSCNTFDYFPTLQENVRYYIEALMFNGSDQNHLSIGVCSPGAVYGTTPIPIKLLSYLWIKTCVSYGCATSTYEKCIYENGSFAVCSCIYGQKIINNTAVCKENNYVNLQAQSVYIESELTLLRDTYLATLERIGIEYIISFEVKPLFYNDELRSILYILSLDGKSYFAFWFENKLLNIFQKGTSNGILYKTPFSLPLMEWSRVKVSQKVIYNTHAGNMTVLEINLNGVLNFSYTNMYSNELLNPTVYVSGPLNPSLNGSIRNLMIISGNYDSMFMDVESPIVPNNLLTTLNVLYEDFMVTFSLKPTVFSGIFANVLFLSIYRSQVYGDNNPAVFFQYGPRLQFVSGINGTTYSSFYSSTVFSINQWTDIKILQRYSNGNYVYSVVINGLIEYSTVNTQPKVFYNMYVYASSNVHTNQVGYIRNLYIVSRMEAQWSDWSSWSNCSLTCCVINRTRICISSYWSDCFGNSTDFMIGKDISSVWSAWTTCSSLCGFGVMSRTRKYCLLPNGSVSEDVVFATCFNNSFCKESLFLENLIVLQPNSLLSNLNVFYEEFVVTVDIYLNETDRIGNILDLIDYSGVLNFLFIRFFSQSLDILSGIEVVTYDVYPNTWNSITLAQQLVDGNYTNSIALNGTILYSVINLMPEVLFNISVYACLDPCMPGAIKNLYIGSKTQANWLQWSEWSSCNLSCVTNRTRVCSRNKWIDCIGVNIELSSCNISNKVDWGNWSPWSSCNGSMNRSRVCNNLCLDCIGNNTDQAVCSPIKASWGQWSNWSICNVLFGYGNMSRSRACNALNSNESCSGKAIETMVCFKNISEIWAVWSDCSVSCGLGYRKSYSLNNNRSTAIEKFEGCQLINCPIDGMWSNWMEFGCSSSCSGETKVFNRSCDNPYPAYFGQSCMGVSNYKEMCDVIEVCSVNGGWAQWSSWSLCNQPCQGGAHHRIRSCSNPIPKYGGLYCNGLSQENNFCFWKVCKKIPVIIGIFFPDEDYIEPYMDLKTDASLALGVKIHSVIKNLYRSHMMNVTFNVVLNSIEKQP